MIRIVGKNQQKTSWMEYTCFAATGNLNWHAQRKDTPPGIHIDDMLFGRILMTKAGCDKMPYDDESKMQEHATVFSDSEPHVPN